MSTVVESINLDITSSSTEAELSHCSGPRIEQLLDQTFPVLFEQQVANAPSQIAVVSNDGQLTYAELNAKANQLARRLRQCGVQREAIVGICIDRSLDMAVGILGILKAGAGYLPLDPDYPEERLTWLLNDSAVSTIVTKKNLVAKVGDVRANAVLLGADDLNSQSTENLDIRPDPNELAYVIYTSGSTGDPKGVLIEHANLANYLLALQLELELTPEDRYLHTASISFSSSRRQLLLPLSQGATVVIASFAERKDPLALFEMIKLREVTVMDAVPSFWRTCTELLLSLDEQARDTLLQNRLRLMLSASEPLLSDIPQTWMHRFNHPARHVHMFGQTETAGIVCTYKIPTNDNGDVSAVPIGKPIANTEIYILDELRRPVPLGTPGELYIGGAGVGRGYLKRPDVSAHKFITHAFPGERAVRLYRTGDFARLTQAGLLEFAGRQDSQVKVRGFRIELGEIEATLARHPGIKQNAVVAHRSHHDANELTAYFVSRETRLAVTELRSFLSARLPDYMIPSTFVELQALPLTANGKIDKRALPEPARVRTNQTKYHAPSTGTEKLLINIWSNVLGIEVVGVDDDFLELGGHSLLAIQVMSRINCEFKRVVPLRTLFEYPTVRRLGALIDSLAGASQKPAVAVQRVDRNEPLELSFPQQRLWFIDQLETESSLYNINKALLLRGPLDIARLQRAVESITARHEILRTTFIANDGLPAQVIAPVVEIPFRFEDLRSLVKADRQAEVERLINGETERPFDLARGPLMRLLLIRTDDAEHVLLLSIHHIISDAWTIKLFFRELARFYEAPQEELAQLPIQYADFADWQRRNFDGGAAEIDLDYWKTQLKDAPVNVNLPSDFPVPAAPTFRGAQKGIVLPALLYESLRNTCRQEGVTLFMLLLAAFQILLSIYSGLDDVLVGTPIAGRELLETEGLFGCFINTLVMRGNLSGNPTLSELLQRVRGTAIDAYTHQSVPFEKLVEELRPERTLSRNPLFQTMFVLQNETEPEFVVNGIQTETMRLSSSSTKFDLTLSAAEKPDSIEVSISYSTDLFAHASAGAILEDFKHVLEALTTNPQQRVKQLLPLRWQPKVPASIIVTSPSAGQTPAYTAPRTPIEEKLVAIWQEVLRVSQVGVSDNFFDLGGHSLLAAQVISRARTALAVELPLRQLFETPNIAGLAEAIYRMQTADTEDDELEAMLAELSQISEEEARQRFADRSN